MKSMLEETKLALQKSKDDMAHYYDRHREPTPVFKPGEKVYLNGSDINTTQPLKKLSHWFLGPYPVICAVAEVINREPEYEVKAILDSQCFHN
jgi:hypothetical protein